MHDRYIDGNEDSILNQYTKSARRRERRVMDSEVERVVDKIYDDVYEKILEWKEDNAVNRYSATLVDYRYHATGTMKYAEAFTDAIAEELANRIIDDGELNETTYWEEY